MNTLESKDRFVNIDGLRTIACIGIVLMHIMTNINYSLQLVVIPKVIDQFGNFVFLFMIISSFAMCCGYYDKFKNNTIDTEMYYSKRVKKILPFFLFLVVVDVITEHNLSSVIEGFADSTLLFGFIQKEISVIGVAWFLGLIFIFYIMFPYFVYLFSNKKRAWIVTFFAALMNITSIYYFNIERSNMFYSFIYFCIGGLIYLYRDSIIKFCKNYKIIGLISVILSICFYCIIPMDNEYLILLKTGVVAFSILLYAISYKSILLGNRITKFIGNISFEIYLCHMVVFRIIEKLKLTHVVNNNFLSYVIVFSLVFCGSVILSIIFKTIYSLFSRKVIK